MRGIGRKRRITLTSIENFLHSINLDSIKGEIKYKYDRDNSAYLLWGKRRGEKGIGVDTIPQILEEQGIHIDAINEADIFFEIDAQYRNAVKSLKKKAKDMLSETRLESEGLVYSIILILCLREYSRLFFNLEGFVYQYERRGRILSTRRRA